MDRHPQVLPPYRSLFVVDVKDFNGREGSRHAELTKDIPQILRLAFERAGLAQAWQQQRFHRHTGDGYFAGFDSAMLPLLLNPLLSALQDELLYRNARGLAAGHGQPLRMRAAITVGPVTEFAKRPTGDRSGDAQIETHRLVDADPVRNLLTRSGDTTCLAAIVSERAYHDAVASGYSAERPDLYVPVEVEAKSYRSRAFLRVPSPSGELLAKGFVAAEPAGSAPARAPDERRGATPTTSTVLDKAYARR
ncbi:hypothetical protein [Thermocrispum sp.]|nr:hypothetical protein [Thermocrispum sp.]